MLAKCTSGQVYRLHLQLHLFVNPLHGIQSGIGLISIVLIPFWLVTLVWINWLTRLKGEQTGDTLCGDFVRLRRSARIKGTWLKTRRSGQIRPEWDFALSGECAGKRLSRVVVLALGTRLIYFFYFSYFFLFTLIFCVFIHASGIIMFASLPESNQCDD